MSRKHLLLLIVLAVGLMVPALAAAGETQYDIIVVNNTEYYVGYLMHGPQRASGDLAPHDVLTLKTHQTAYFANETTYDYNLLLICAWNQVVSLDLKIVNIYTAGPTLLAGKCSIKAKNNKVSCWEVTGQWGGKEKGPLGTTKKLTYVLTLSERR